LSRPSSGERASCEPRVARRAAGGALAAVLLGLVTGIGCVGRGGNNDVEGTCLPPVEGAVPLTCNRTCACGTGGRCDHGKCVSCHCGSDEVCNAGGECVGNGPPSPWYAGEAGPVGLRVGRGRRRLRGDAIRP
jgi:hypothetical protein